jgi:hypothetical protein
MSPAGRWGRWNALDRWVRAAVVLWAVILASSVAHAAVKHGWPTLDYLWRHTGASWVEGKALYDYERNREQAGFRYGPPYAVLFVPLYWLPGSLAAVGWRLANAAIFLAALFWWLRHAAVVRLEERLAGMFFAIAAVLSLANLYPGQLNLLLAALLLFAVTAVQQQRWTLAALAVALGTILKMYPLAFGLLLVAVYPRKMAWRVAVMLLLVAGVPFLFGAPHYVWGQYADWFWLLGRADSGRRFQPLTSQATYRDLLLLFRLLNIPISLPMYSAVLAGCGLACAGFCVAARRKGAPSRVVLFHVLMLGSLWMTVCGPASETKTYGLLIPALSWWFVWTYHHGPEPARFLATLVLGAHLLSALAPLSGQAMYFFHAGGLLPLSALALLGSYLAGLPALRAAGSEPAEVLTLPRQAA